MRTLLTGARGALGSSVLAALVARGDRVAAIGGDALEAMPGTVEVIERSDLADSAAAERAAAQAVAFLGEIDAVIHLAGGFAQALVLDSTPADWEQLYRANLGSAINMLKAALPSMPDGGAIVCVGAASAHSAGIGMAPYTAAKSGVERLVEALSHELAPRRIRANAILPGTIDTPRNRQDMPNANFAKWTSPQAIAEVVLFLTARGSRAINGAALPVTNAA